MWLKAGLAILSVLDFLSGQIELWQIRQGARAAAERDELMLKLAKLLQQSSKES